jgi:hypothetical protein
VLTLALAEVPPSPSSKQLLLAILLVKVLLSPPVQVRKVQVVTLFELFMIELVTETSDEAKRLLPLTMVLSVLMLPSYDAAEGDDKIAIPPPPPPPPALDEALAVLMKSPESVELLSAVPRALNVLLRPPSHRSKVVECTLC